VSVSHPASATVTAAAAISRACVRILRECTGRGPTEAKTYGMDDQIRHGSHEPYTPDATVQERHGRLDVGADR
jgi:hypothetical protein